MEVVKPNSTQAGAYRIAYPRSKKWQDRSVWNKASMLAAKDRVRSRINDLRSQIEYSSIMDINEALVILTKVGRADSRKCYNQDGSIKLPHEIDDDTSLGLMEIQTVEQAGEGKVITRGHRIKMIKRTEAIEKILKYHAKRVFTPNGDEVSVEELEQKMDYDAARRIAYALTMDPAPEITKSKNKAKSAKRVPA